MTSGRDKSKTFGRTLAASVFALAIAAAPALGATVDDLIDDARSYRTEGRLSESVIQIKNVLQRDPSNGVAHALLGAIYLDAGDLPRAVDELERGRDLGAPLAEWLVPLLNVRLAQGRGEDAMQLARDLPQTLDPALRAEALAVAGRSLLPEQTEAARSVFREALALNDNSPMAQVGLGRTALVEDDIAAADSAAQKALALAPRHPDVLHLAAEVARRQGDVETALSHYRTLTDVHGQNPFVRLPLAAALLEAGKVEEAATELDWVLERVDGLPRAHYLRAVAAFMAEDNALAEREISRVLALVPQDNDAQLLAGLVKVRQGEHEQAVRLLGGIGDRPDNARIARAAALLALGRAEEAYAEVEPVAPRLSGNAEALALLGQAAAGAGDPEAARTALMQAIELRPEDSGLYRSLGAVEAGAGSSAAAVDALRRAVELNPEDLTAASQLFSMLLSERRLEEARALARQVQEQAPDTARGWTMEGLTYIGTDDAAARDAFRTALDKEPDAADAAGNLATLMLMAGEVDGARTVLTDTLEQAPRHTGLMLRLAELETGQGDTGAARGWLEKAMQTDSGALEPRRQLAELLLREGGAEQALSVLVPALNTNPRDPGVLRLVTEARLRVGQPRDALAAATTLAEVEPTEASYRILAEAAMRTGDRPMLRDALEKVAEVAPNDPRPRVMLADMHRVNGDLKEARRLVDAAREVAPDNPAVLEEHARLLLAEDPQEGLAVLREEVSARGDEAPRGLVSLLAGAEYDAGETGAAIDRVAAWVDSHPDDAAARWMLATWQIETGAWDGALDSLRHIVDTAPTSWAARNNLAWVLLQKGAHDEALTQIEAARAVLTEEKAPLLDTEARVRLAMGEPETAERLFRRASQLEDTAAYDLGLAEALIAQDRDEEARDVLNDLVASAPGPEQREQANALLAKVSR